MLYTPLFSPKFLADAAKPFSQELADLQERALPVVREWQDSLRSGALAATKEEQLQSDFLEAVFAKILGYESSRGAVVWNLEKEQKNVTDSQKADGALGFFTMQNGAKTSDIRAVIELKGTKSDLDKPQNRKDDKHSPVEQAFAYGSKTGGKCRWVIVSNIVEIRLYHVTDQSRYERFELKTLHEHEQLRRFVFLLHRARLLNSTNPDAKSELDTLHEQRKEQERTISNEFYGKYKAARVRLFEHLKAQNPACDDLLLLQKAQKLLDRLLFVFFCEDLNLLPRETAKKVIQNAKQSFSAQEGEIWRQLKGLFTAIDKGNPPNNISKFNGGLFAPDAEMDALAIADSEIESLLQFSEYDFDSDLNVRILGHIFEQSVSDIEELKASIEASKGLKPLAEKTIGKRKRDGVFYTPEYITRFIVQNTVGAYLEERKLECGFGELPLLTDEDFAGISVNNKGVVKANKRIEQHTTAWNAYREHVRTVRVCDPACGSGAFLIEVFDFLYAEAQRVNAELSRLRGGQTEVFDLEKHILTRNIFGVDVNAEAVEITKLSLWLKTANKGKELTDLDDNIKCGNSLVDDPNVAGAAAFDWAAAFPDVFGAVAPPKNGVSKGLKPLVEETQSLQAYHVTWVTHNSRVSERMIEYEAVIKYLRTNKGLQPLAQPLEMDEDMEHSVLALLCDVIEEKGFRVLALNICRDHVHCMLVCEESERDTIVQQMKGKTTFLYKKAHAVSGEFHLWAQKYHYNHIESEQELYAVMQYVEHNRLKHELSEGKGLKPLVQRVLTPLNQAFTPFPNKGLQPLAHRGFDVIVGNPPYVRQELLPEAMKAFLAKNYTVAHGSADLYAYFMERSVNLLKNGGLYSIIVANKWMRASYGEPLRRWIKTQSLEEIVDFGDLPVFEDAIAYPCVLRVRKGAPREEFRAANITTLDFESLAAEVERTRFAVRVAQLQDEGWSLANKAVSDVLAKLRAAGMPLGEYVQGKIYRGVLTGLNEAFVVDAATRARLIAEDPCSADVLKPFLAGRDVKRYATPEAENYLIFARRGIDISQYPAIERHLSQFKDQLMPKPRDWQGSEWQGRKAGSYKWYELQDAVDYFTEFEKSKIIVPAIVQSASYLVDASGFYSNDKTSIIGVDDKALLAVLNSKATDFFMHSIAATKQGGFYEYKPMYLVQLPIPPFATRGLSPLLSSHVETMIATNKNLADLRKRVLTVLLSKTGIQKASTKLQEWDALTWVELEAEINKGLKPLASKGGKSKLSLNDKEELLQYFEQKKAEAERLKTTLAATDRAIDALVYGLYGLTAEEIRVVEGGA
jgi:type I restriction-modification system DNA methylase subunit/REP element-mobilizing transposase RayT